MTTQTPETQEPAPKADTDTAGPPASWPDTQFHMVQGQVIVAVVSADCVECAGKIRDDKYPGCLIGWIVDESRRTGHCIRTEDPVEAYYRMGYTRESVRRLLADRVNRPRPSLEKRE